jgi:hypothetical protein
MHPQRTVPTNVEAGQVYEGWGKTWRVSRVWETERVAEIVNVDDDRNSARLPLKQFKELRRGA